MESQPPSPADRSGAPPPAGKARPEQPAPRLLEQVRNVMRLRHYSIHTERSYLDWIRRYIHFHHMRSREELAGGEAKIEAFCTDLAVNGKVSPSTQNQAFNALIFLYRQVLKLPLEEKINAVRAERKINVPVVMTREEVAKVIALLEAEPQLIVKLPYALERKYPNAAREFGWQYLLPSRELSTDPLTGVVRRHHVDPTVVNRAIKAAVRRAGLTKRDPCLNLPRRPW